MVAQPSDSSRPVQANGLSPGRAERTFQAYLEYNRVLRTWFVAFGVGGPALFLANDKIAQRLAQAHQLRLVVILFLLGALGQIIGSLLNKAANWYVYRSTTDTGVEGRCRHRVAQWWISRFWPDIVLDLWTISAFGYAAWLLLTVFSRAV